jgi:hypothetical protein
MDAHRKQICQTIIRECKYEGFVPEALEGTFLRENFEKLITTLKEYQQLNYGKDTVEIEIASSMLALMDALRHYIHFISGGEERVMLESAYVAAQRIIQETLWPDYLQDNAAVEKKWDLNLT